MKKIVLLGNPNVGKSSLFNLLTKSRQKVMNVPRTTIDIRAGKWRDNEIIDLPGTFSLNSASPDEKVANDYILKQKIDLVIVLASADNLHSSLFLYYQALNKVKTKVILAWTKTDIDSEVVDGIKNDIESKNVKINPRLNKGILELKDLITSELESAEALKNSKKISDSEIFTKVASILKEEYRKPVLKTKDDKVDKFLLNKFIGFPLFILCLFIIFQIVITLLLPLQELIHDGVIHGFGDLLLKIPFVSAHPIISSFVIDGFLEGFSIVISFVPLIALIFLFISILEDSGYLSRVAFLLNNFMNKIGLEGVAYLPLILGFSCNLPALEGTKVVNNQKRRKLLGFMLPYTLCSARLVVFTFIASIFFPKNAPLVIVLLYIISILWIIIIGFIYQKKNPKNSTDFVIALNPYQFPELKNICRNVYFECKMFVLKAGKIIVLLCVLSWGLMVIKVPVSNNISNIQNTHISKSSKLLEVDSVSNNSLYNIIASKASVVLKPTGFGNQDFTAAILTGFIAKEAVVGSITTAYYTKNPNLENINSSIKESLNESSNGHTNLAAFCFLLFVLIYTPCAAAFALSRKIFGKKFAAKSVLFSVICAWFISTVVFQVFSRI